MKLLMLFPIYVLVHWPAVCSSADEVTTLVAGCASTCDN